MRVASLLIFAACGPGFAQPASRLDARDTLARASGDAVAIERLLQGAVVDGGLWFADPECMRQFAGGGEITPARFHTFAACLATLHWQSSQRGDALGDTLVLEYAPGFEIEARLVQELTGPRLLWIGYEARRDWDDGLPTVTVATLESLRMAGDPGAALAAEARGLLARDVASYKRASAWFKVCLDGTGAVSGTDEREVTSLEAWHVFAAAIGAWRFRPFTIDGRALPVCAMVHFEHPHGTAGKVTERLPLPAPPSRQGKKTPVVLADGAEVIEARRVSGQRLIEPDVVTRSAIAEANNPKVVGAFRVCLDDTGHVESVLPLRSTGFASYDRTIIAGINTWIYSPFVVDGEPTPICTSVTFIYRQRRW